MKLQLKQLIGAREPLQRLAVEKYPAHIAYRIQRNLRAIETETRIYETARADLIKNKYGEKNNDTYRVPPEKVAEFAAEINLLLDEEVEVDITRIELGALHEITPIDLMALEWMFDVPAEAEKPAIVPRARTRRGH